MIECPVCTGPMPADRLPAPCSKPCRRLARRVERSAGAPLMAREALHEELRLARAGGAGRVHAARSRAIATLLAHLPAAERPATADITDAVHEATGPVRVLATPTALYHRGEDGRSTFRVARAEDGTAVVEEWRAGELVASAEGVHLVDPTLN